MSIKKITRELLKGKKWLPVTYSTIYGMLIPIAKKHGYALALHGSMVRDLDLVAVPWTAKASSHRKLIGSIKKAIGSPQTIKNILDDVGIKPHGRKAYTILSGDNTWIDLSITSLI